jgi:hypothetical protein
VEVIALPRLQKIGSAQGPALPSVFLTRLAKDVRIMLIYFRLSAGIAGQFHGKNAKLQ